MTTTTDIKARKYQLLIAFLSIAFTINSHSMAVFHKIRNSIFSSHNRGNAHQEHTEAEQENRRNTCSGYSNHFYGTSKNNFCWGNHNYFHRQSQGNICWGNNNNINGDTNWIFGSNFNIQNSNGVHLSRKATIIATLMVPESCLRNTGHKK